MPIYPYTCNECGRAFEVIRCMSERDEPVVCPDCESPEVERHFGRCAVVVCGGHYVGKQPPSPDLDIPCECGGE